jgi:hypothetical protein
VVVEFAEDGVQPLAFVVARGGHEGCELADLAGAPGVGLGAGEFVEFLAEFAVQGDAVPLAGDLLRVRLHDARGREHHFQVLASFGEVEQVAAVAVVLLH